MIKSTDSNMHDPRWMFADKNETLGYLNWKQGSGSQIRVAELSVTTYI